jgi:hypothetical protein
MEVIRTVKRAELIWSFEDRGIRNDDMMKCTVLSM